MPKLPRNLNYITIPDHNPIKVGTLNRIITDIAKNLKISKEELISNII